MLPAFLSYYIGRDPAAGSAGAGLLRKALSGLGAGLLVSLGFAGSSPLPAYSLRSGLRSIIGAVPSVTVLIGVLLAGVGVARLAGHRVRLSLNSNRIEPGRPWAWLGGRLRAPPMGLHRSPATWQCCWPSSPRPWRRTAFQRRFLVVAYAAGASMVLIHWRSPRRWSVEPWPKDCTGPRATCPVSPEPYSCFPGLDLSCTGRWPPASPTRASPEG